MATDSDTRLSNTDFDLWGAIAAIDRKDYDYWDRLTPEQQRKFVPYMMLHWISCVSGKSAVSDYYLRSTDYHANMHMFNEAVAAHPKLQWLMLCASSPGLGKQRHQWLPHLKSSVTALKESAKLKDTRDYWSKVWPNADPADIAAYATEWVNTQHRSVYLAQQYPQLKLDDITTLNAITSEQEIKQHQQDTTV